MRSVITCVVESNRGLPLKALNEMDLSFLQYGDSISHGCTFFDFWKELSESTIHLSWGGIILMPFTYNI